jgi:hypothetical protein
MQHVKRFIIFCSPQDCYFYTYIILKFKEKKETQKTEVRQQKQETKERDDRYCRIDIKERVTRRIGSVKKT